MEPLQFDTYYHIYNHANGDDNLFIEEKNYSFFLKKFDFYIKPIADTIAWCLMPNHFHILVKVKSEKEVIENLTTEIEGAMVSSKIQNFRKDKDSEFKLRVEKFIKGEKDEKLKFLSKQFANFFTSYTQAFNKMYERRGSLFMKNFKRKAIYNEVYLRNIILYIHLNSVKHGFVNEISDWKWTSFPMFFDENNELARNLFGDENNLKEVHSARQKYFDEYSSLEKDLT